MEKSENSSFINICDAFNNTSSLIKIGNSGKI